MAGIDEAGFGPVLGPLTVSAVVFGVPDAKADADLWDELAPAVAAKPGKRHAGVAVGDSKRIYSPKTGLVHLERGVLGFLAAVNDEIGTLRALLGRLCPEAVEQMAGYPWYREADVEIPVDADATDLRLRSNGLRTALEAAAVTFLGAASRVLLVDQYNRMVAATDNKATTLGDQTFSLIDWVWRNRPTGQSVRVMVDRQGGRRHYLPHLQRMYPGGSAYQILVEQPDHSGYRLAFGSEHLEVHFLRKGESRQMPIALASMTSKYLRELFMKLLNRYWIGQPGGADLKPTAGYYTDGHRFLIDIAEARKRLGTPDHLLIRSR